MRNDRKERLLRELERRLGSLECLARVTRREVVEHSRAHLTAGKIAAYLADRVVFLEQWIAPLDHPGFLGVCHELGPIRTRDELHRRLGLRSTDASGWLVAAVRFHQDKPRSLFCVVNGWALQFRESTGNEEAVSLWAVASVAGALSWMGRSASAVALLEGRLELTGADYAEPAELTKHLREMTAGLAPKTAASLVGIVAGELQSVDQSNDAIALLEGRLGLTGANCTARLLDAHGVERAQASVHEHALKFALADVDHSGTLARWTFACDYRWEKLVDARFAVGLQPPGSGLARCAE
jgi:hypothetical protein